MNYHMQQWQRNMTGIYGNIRVLKQITNFHYDHECLRGWHETGQEDNAVLVDEERLLYLCVRLQNATTYWKTVDPDSNLAIPAVT
jgi:hypothetical protein